MKIYVEDHGWLDGAQVLRYTKNWGSGTMSSVVLGSSPHAHHSRRVLEATLVFENQTDRTPNRIVYG